MSGNDEERDGISPATRQILATVNLRRHSVALERVQRIHLDIDNERMDFTAATVAQMLQDVADQCDENEAFTIHAVVRALRGEDDNHHLELKQKKPGKFHSPTEHEEHHLRIMSWLHQLAHLEKDGMKTEAAVADISERWGASRAAVFAGVREAEQFLESGRAIFPDNGHFASPRPDKKRKT